MKLPVLLIACVVMWSAAVGAAPPRLDAEQQRVVTSAGFLSAHPDLRYRREGVAAYEDGRYEAAADYFRKAARYADKASQAMYAEMLWNGAGIPRDRPLAYAWMDLAAERGYRTFLGKRERYWSELSDAEREQALGVGRRVYEEYGDTVAKPRLESRLRRATQNITGSRVGFVGALEIVIPTAGGTMTIDANTYYDDRFWKPEQYWEWQDQVWSAPRRGNVEILPIEAVDGSKPANEG